MTGSLEGKAAVVRFLPSDIANVERMEIIRDPRLGQFELLVGINLLRHGLGLPEGACVSILAADQTRLRRSSRPWTGLLYPSATTHYNNDSYETQLLYNKKSIHKEQ
ncbi:hypothetical protein [Klebsiella pneumoniae]|uniref:hypothetical protein n=1 Tax=Klebsiella pneumoniae TaxID=573 RepID=UPI003D66332D